jgi:hypothetical protein
VVFFKCKLSKTRCSWTCHVLLVFTQSFKAIGKKTPKTIEILMHRLGLNNTHTLKLAGKSSITYVCKNRFDAMDLDS